jgi:D-amino-acid dehydrogenase
MSRHLVVIGAGIVGVCSALELLRDGHQVTLVEPGPPGGEQAASFGNGAFLSTGSIIPMSMPGTWRKVPGWLADPLGPLTIRWSALPALLPWLIRFLRAGATVERVRKTAAALAPMVADSPARHFALATEAGVPDLIQRTGLLYVFPDRAAFEAEGLGWQLRAENGVTWTELDAETLYQTEPSLDRRYTFGVRVDASGHCRDPGAYVAALVAHAQGLGAVFVQAAATGFDIRDFKLAAVRTTTGPIACDGAVIAAGIASRALADSAGDRVPLASERGYHVVIKDPEVGPRIPVMPSDGKMANTMTSKGLRAAGQVELAAVSAPPNWARADVLLKHLLGTYPGLPKTIAPDRISRWMGHRPSTPDGLPVIGPSRACPDIVHSFGHGHIGLISGPMTGRLVADIVAGLQPTIPIAPFSPRRFASLI